MFPFPGPGNYSAACATSTVSLNGNTYCLKAHPRVWLDGPSGAFSASLQNASGKYNSSNPAYAALLADVTAFQASNVCSTAANTYSGYKCPGGNTQANVYNMSAAANAALLWYAQGANSSDPNGYLATAIYGYEHFEDFGYGSFACDLSNSYTYCGGRDVDIYADMVLDYVWTGFSIIRAQWIAQKGSGEITTFAEKVLNDNDTSHNGISSSACTNIPFSTGTGTISVSGNVVTGSGTSFTSALSVGSVIFQSYADDASKSPLVGTVYSITSNTQVILTTTGYNATPSGTWRYAPAWTSTNCGLVYFIKHHQSAPPLIAAQFANYQTNYPPDGNTSPGYDGNKSLDAILSYIELALALADDDARAGVLLTEAFNWYTPGLYSLNSQYGMYPMTKAGMTGFGEGGGYYFYGVWQGAVSLLTQAIRNSTVSGIDLSGGNYLAVAPAFDTMMALPSLIVGRDTWVSFDNWANVYYPPNDLQGQQRGGMEVCGLLPTAPYCGAFYQALRARSDYTSAIWGATGGQFVPWYYTFNDPTISASSLATSQMVFKTPDFSAAQCASQFPSSVCPANQIFQGAISKSDWTSTASQMMIRAGYVSYGQDHSGAEGYESGSYHLFRNGKYLTAGDAPGASYILDGENTILIGSSSNWNQGTGFAPITRWAGADFTGIPGSAYAYTMINLAPSYTSGANVTAASRELIQSKPSSQQDYALVYDYVALSSGAAINAYHHYALNFGSSSNVTYTNGGLTVTNNQTSAVLNTAILPVTGTNTIATNNTYSDANGNTVRVTSCPEGANSSTCSTTATSFEEISIEQPINGGSGSMPTLTQPACTGTGGNCAAVQIADSGEPRVIAFGRQGALLTGATFTTTHSGTAQYILSGFSGSRSVTVGGTAVTGSPFAVVAGDTTIEFSSTAGAVVVF